MLGDAASRRRGESRPGRWARFLVIAVCLAAACGDRGASRAAREPAIQTVRPASGTSVSAAAFPSAPPATLPVGAPNTTTGSPATGPAPDRGLLLVRERLLLVRDMVNGREYVLRGAGPGTQYAYPRWSPDGKRIAYVIQTPATGQRDLNWGGNVAISAADGSDERLVFERAGPGTTIEGLAWTADGSGLLLGINEQEIKDGRFLGSHLRLERLDLAGGRRTVLAEDAAYPAAAPDGSRIAFLSYSREGGPDGLWTARPDGSDRRLLVRSGDGQAFAGLRWPRWSPDGRLIAFGGIDAASAGLPPPVCPSGFRWPWQPRVAEAHGPPVDVWVVATGGGAPERLAELHEDDPYLAWSPDGGALAALGACGLYRVPAAGGTAEKVGQGAVLAQIDWR
jgi:dipeptidyl aminopeptidase/acylaminoacyl peptidase